ncbi:LOW QUALITY PROTEIN: long-chain fatty acid transport protein 2-like [Liolophura sinensis]|uniref:LOW QUALITY PROTEIN: long-chain fatty acid transport protein 2-like n=1 Tax=Liolophura sinensis TaxID=3198878 RepID=UPI0031593160
MFSQIVYTLFGAVGAGALVVKFCFPWVLYDISYLRTMNKAISKITKRAKKKEMLIDIFEEVTKANRNKTFFVFEEETFSYEEVEEKSTRVARGAMALGVRCGDVVAMMIANEPRFIWTYLGFLKLGVRMTMINTSLKGKQLLFQLQTGQPKLLIVGEDFVDAVKAVSSEIKDTDVYTYGDNCPSTPFQSFDDVLASTSATTVDHSVRTSVNVSDVACYIFTSGTTGLPKAALCTQYKLLAACHILSASGMTSEDTLYLTLPLYHSSALALGLGAVIQSGAKMVLKKRFSASAFWEDCRTHDVTVILYIGELCRYLVSAPRKTSDRLHKVRLAFGNGLRMDIWKEFKERFCIPTIAEFYGATEGSSSMLNVANKIGAVGRLSPVLQKLIPQRLVEYVTEDATPLRDSCGRCIQIKPGATGLLLSPVSKKFPYEGYLGPKAVSDRKLVRDVIVPGDVYFNTGDVFYLDNDYFVYFRDRLGDTFRWKGENVSTTEVANVLTETRLIMDANVYGVKIPGQEGRAGMAAILANDGRPLTEGQRRAIYRLSEDLLASYARPRFLRVVKHGQLTVTFKQKKQELVKEGFDIYVVKDPLYFLDQENKDYVPLTEDLYLRVINGGVRV